MPLFLAFETKMYADWLKWHKTMIRHKILWYSWPTNIDPQYILCNCGLQYLENAVSNAKPYYLQSWLVGWLFWGLTALWDGISVYIGPSPREREWERRNDRREKNNPNNPTAPTASAIGPCPTIIQISRTPWHWKFTQHHHTTRPPLIYKEFHDYFSIYIYSCIIVEPLKRQKICSRRHFNFLLSLSKKIRLDFSCESSA